PSRNPLAGARYKPKFGTSILTFSQNKVSPVSSSGGKKMETQTFDYIVVGAGSAGSVLANRLSADPKHRVLALEAGRESHPWSRIPVGFARLIENPAANWLYSSEPEDSTGNRRI